jgi:hypothetical protein
MACEKEMMLNPTKSKDICFMRAKEMGAANYLLQGAVILEVSNCK